MLRNLLIVLFSQFVVISAMAGELRVGLSPDYPPLIFKQDGRIVGIEADNITAVSKIIGQKMTVVEMPAVKLLPALQAGEIDVVMSGMSVTAERSELVTFTDAYMQMGQMAIMHKDKVAQFAQPWSVYREGVRIGVEPGTTGAYFAEQELKDAQVKYVADAAAAFASLRNDEIDLYIHDAPTSWRLATTTENGDLISLYSPLTDEMLAWAVRKDDDALAGELNRALAKMKASGTLRYILNRWIPVTVEVR
jgi:polar amino acid transport system substrate-binding protein